MTYVRTQSATELLRNACSLYGKHFGRLIAGFALIGLPSLLIDYYLASTLSIPLMIAGAVVGLLGGVLAYGTLITITSEICVGVLPDLSRAYGRMFRFSLPLLFAGLLQMLAVLFGMMLLIVPGIVAGVFFMFAIPIIVLERRSGLAALGRSWQLSRHFFWRNFGLLGITSVAGGIVGAILGSVFGILVGLLRLAPHTQILLFGLLQGALYTMIIPLSLMLNTLMYYDLRARKEGYDPTQLTQELQY